jgi:hypothetical protein
MVGPLASSFRLRRGGGGSRGPRKPPLPADSREPGGPVDQAGHERAAFAADDAIAWLFGERLPPASSGPTNSIVLPRTTCCGHDSEWHDPWKTHTLPKRLNSFPASFLSYGRFGLKQVQAKAM